MCAGGPGAVATELIVVAQAATARNIGEQTTVNAAFDDAYVASLVSTTATAAATYSSKGGGSQLFTPRLYLPVQDLEDFTFKPLTCQ